MQKFFIAIILFIAVILQISFFPIFFKDGLAPDLALILIIIWTARFGFEKIWPWAVLAGAMLDITSFSLIGTNILSLAAIAFVINYLAKRFLVTHTAWKFLILGLFVILGTFLNELIILFIAKSLSVIKDGGGIKLMVNINIDILQKAVFNLFIYALIYWPLGKLESQISPYAKRIIIRN